MNVPIASRPLVRRGAYLAAVAGLAAAVAHPTVVREGPALEFVVVFDVSLSMATEDVRDAAGVRSRLDAAKDAFRAVVPRLPRSARVTLAGAAGQTAQVFLLSHPVTDADAIDAALRVLEWDNVWDVGSRIDLVLRDVAAQAKGSRVFSAANRRRVLAPPFNLVFFSDGGGPDVSDAVLGDAARWLREHARVTLVGVGEPVESVVPEFRRADARDCLRDETGRCLVSRLDESNLQALADGVGGRYLRLGDPAALAAALLDDPVQAGTAPRAEDVGWLFGLASLLAFLAWVVW